MTLDLSELVKPIAFEAPHLGRVEVDAISGEFLDWFASVDEALDGDGIMRRVLRDKVVGVADQVEGADPCPSAELLRTLTSDDIEAAAGAFLQASGMLFRPSLIEVERRRNAARRVRVRRSNEAYDIAPQSGERETDRLRRLLRAALQDRRDHDRLLTQNLEPRLGTAAATMAAADVGGVERLARLAADLPGARLARLAAGSPSLQAVHAAQSSSILRAADVLERSAVMRAARLWAETPAATAAAGVRSMSILRDHEQVLRNVGLLGRSPALAIADAGLTFPKDLLGGGVYARMVETAHRTSLAATAASRITASPRIAWLTEVNRTLSLGLSPGTLAAVGALGGADFGADPLSAAADALAYVRPGWQATAAVGVSESFVRAAAAALLRSYDEPAAGTTGVFGAAGELAHAVDEAGDDLFERLLVLVRQGRDAFQARSRPTGDAVEQQGLNANLALLLTLASLLVALWSAQIARTALEVAREGATTEDVRAAAQAEIAAYREEAARDREARRDDDVRLRKVATPTPLLAAPEMEAQLLQTVHPEELIRVLDERGEWVKLEVFGYRNETIATGWVQRSQVRHR